MLQSRDNTSCIAALTGRSLKLGTGLDEGPLDYVLAVGGRGGKKALNNSQSTHQPTFCQHSAYQTQIRS